MNHPNSHLPTGVIETGVSAVASAFVQCRMTPRQVTMEPLDCSSLIFGELMGKNFVVYVRITLEGEVVEGTGPIPSLLSHVAEKLYAEPHVIRVHMVKAGQGTSLGYYGLDEFIDSVRSNSDEWNAKLLAPRTFDDYVGMLKGRISTLCLETVVEEIKPEQEGEIESYMTLRLTIDGHEPYAGTIDGGDLLRSTSRGGVYDIFTCTCGVAECAGVWRGVLVTHHEDMVLWKAYYAKGRRVFLFRKEQYRAEILTKCGDVIKFVQGGDHRFFTPYGHNFDCFEKAYNSAEKERLLAESPEVTTFGEGLGREVPKK